MNIKRALLVAAFAVSLASANQPVISCGGGGITIPTVWVWDYATIFVPIYNTTIDVVIGGHYISGPAYCT